MATYPARNSGDQTINYLRAPISGSALGYTGIAQVGTLPAGSLVLRAYVVVSTAFNAGSTNTIKVGIVGSDASILSSAATGTAGVIATTSALATAVAATTAPAVDTQVIATAISTGTLPTAGVGYVVVEYCPVA